MSMLNRVCETIIGKIPNEWHRNSSKLRRLAREQSVNFEVVQHGKGSHSRIIFGGRAATLKDPKKEIGPGLLRAMCRQLGIDPRDLT